jgi:hypothetical protein
MGMIDYGIIVRKRRGKQSGEVSKAAKADEE